jgi:hypothetical protein
MRKKFFFKYPPSCTKAFFKNRGIRITEKKINFCHFFAIRSRSGRSSSQRIRIRNTCENINFVSSCICPILKEELKLNWCAGGHTLTDLLEQDQEVNSRRAGSAADSDAPDIKVLSPELEKIRFFF